MTGTVSEIGSKKHPAGIPAGCETVNDDCLEQWHDQESNNVDDLDERVDCGTGGILVRITDRIARDSSLMSITALAAEVTVFDVLLGIVPSTTTSGHGDGNEDAGDDRAHEHAAQSLRTEADADDDRDQNREMDGTIISLMAAPVSIPTALE